MELFEVETEQTMSREEAAAKLRQLADSLERHNEVEFSLGGIPTRLKVPNQVTLEFEIEVGDESSIEVEISW
ncbi:MAG: amphi-Trp domain-containing protein [Acidimicrobiales bacterium]